MYRVCIVDDDCGYVEYTTEEEYTSCPQCLSPTLLYTDEYWHRLCLLKLIEAPHGAKARIIMLNDDNKENK